MYNNKDISLFEREDIFGRLYSRVEKNLSVEEIEPFLFS